MTIGNLIELLRRFPHDAIVTNQIGESDLNLLVELTAHDPQSGNEVAAVFCFDDPNDSMPWLEVPAQQEN